jgi:fused signal recognition particle receptor
MIFWRKKTNEKSHDEEARDEKLIHHKGEPAIEPSTDYDAEIDPDFRHNELEETEREVIEELSVTPVSHAIDVDAKHENPNGGGWLSRLTEGLVKSTNKFDLGLSDLLSKRKLTDDVLQDLEDLLIMADLGPKTAAKLVGTLRAQKFDKDVDVSEVKQILADEITKILSPIVQPLNVKAAANGPRVYMICGVNGVGKTTTIGKLAYQLHFKQQKKITMAAGDTFRAAAIEQLQVWADRTKCPLIAKDIGADSASVAFEAYEQAVKNQSDILMIDTAGRLHNKQNLMAELEKMIRVLKKKDNDIPHEVILILDSTTGQNAVQQVQTFRDLVNVTGLVVTKLDGSAKGGVVVALADQFGLPIYAVGVGEGIEDLQPFHAAEFARALVGLATD